MTVSELKSALSELERIIADIENREELGIPYYSHFLAGLKQRRDLVRALIVRKEVPF